MIIEIQKTIDGYNYDIDDIVKSAINPSAQAVVSNVTTETFKEPFSTNIITKIIIHIKLNY
jgi:hypothetical protein